MRSPGQRRSAEQLALTAARLTDTAVLAAMGRVERERFVPADAVALAYADRPVPIGWGQTISQPYVVAWMAAALQLRPGERVLDVGTGSGYAAAVMAELGAQVWGIERVPALVERARVSLAAAGYTARVRCGDGTLGWPELAPFAAICVAAAGPSVPPALQQQLAVGGRLVMPVGPEDEQALVRVTRPSAAEFLVEELGPVQFVPLIGAQGWGG